MTPLSKPVVRRIGRLVIRIDATGIAIRRLRTRSWHCLSWAEVAFHAADSSDDLLAYGARQIGQNMLDAMLAEKRHVATVLHAPITDDCQPATDNCDHGSTCNTDESRHHG